MFTIEIHIRKAQNGGGRHIEIQGHNPVAIACICNEFCTEADSGVLEPDLLSRQKSKMRRQPCWNELNGNNSAIIERICTTFYTDTENEV